MTQIFKNYSEFYNRQDKTINGVSEQCGDLKFSTSGNEVYVELELEQHLEHAEGMKVQDFTLTLSNESAKYLHSFLTTFLKLNPK